MTNLGGTGVSENTDFDDEITELLDRQDRLNPLTLAAWQADPRAKAGDVVTTAERTAGFGGGGTGVVLAGTDTANGLDRVQHGTLPLTWALRINGIVKANQVGVIGDNSTNNDAAFVRSDDIATAIGGAEILLDIGTYQIALLFIISANNDFTGAIRSNTVIRQMTTSLGAIKIIGANNVKEITVESLSTNTDTTSIGFDISNANHSSLTNCEAVYFGYGVKSEGPVTAWRQRLINVRVNFPTNTGFHFEEDDGHLQVTLDQCYVQNTSILGLAVKTSYFIDGSQNTILDNCTSDGGDTVGRKNLGLVVRAGRVNTRGMHFERYKVPTGAIVGAEYDSIVSIAGRVTMENTRFQNCFSDNPADDVLIYAENGSTVSLVNVDPNSGTKAAFTSQMIGISNDSGDNLIEVIASDPALTLGEARGTGVGEATYTRKGKKIELTISAPTTIDVNLVDNISLLGTTSTLDGFTGDAWEGKKIRLHWRQAGVTVVHTAGFRLQGNVNFIVTAASEQLFVFSEEGGGIWIETSRYTG